MVRMRDQRCCLPYQPGEIAKVRAGEAPRVRATARNIVTSVLRLTGGTNIAAWLRHHAASAACPDQAIAYLQTC
jgi:hypothetical protein